MIPQTYPSNFNSAGRARMIIYMLPSVSGLTRWIDYIPVKSPTNEANLAVANSFANDGFILTSSLSNVTGLVPFKDYVPVYLDPNATVAWSADNNGYIPMDGLASFFLNFADGTNVLDPRVTFSRSSNATVTDSNGNIVYAPHNLLTFSEQFDNAAWSKTSGTVTANAGVAPDGTTTADQIASTGAGVFRSSITVTQGALHTASVYAKNVSGGGNFIFGFDFGPANGRTTFNLQNGTVVSNDANVVSSSITAVGNGWYRCVVSAVTNSTSCNLVYYNATSGANWLVWGAQLNQGSLQPYYPTTVKNLLGFSEAFENAAWTKSNSFMQTNLLTYSEAFDNAAWNKNRATIAANNTVAPSGQTTADKLVEDTTASNTHQAYASQTVTNGLTYVFSVYAKAGERTQIALNLSSGAGAFSAASQVIVNLSNGSIVSGSGVVSDAGNGWYRISVSNTAIATAAADFILRISVGGNTSYTGDGASGLFIWGAQLVQGASAGDYVQTTSTALPVMYQAPNGTMTADKLVENTTNALHYPQQIVSCTSGTPIILSIYAKAAERTKIELLEPYALRARVFNLSNGTVENNQTGVTNASVFGIENVGNGWYRCYIGVTTAGTSTALRVTISNGSATAYTGDGTSGVLIWGAQISDSASLDPYVNNPVAAPSSTAYYGPRFDYDPVTRQPRGLLIEEARSNIQTNSEDITQVSSWGFAGVTLASNVTTAPSGLITADSITEDTSTGNHQLTSIATIASGTQYAFSFYAKANGRTQVSIAGMGLAGAGFGCVFTLTGSGSVSSAPTGSSITAVGNGWYRCVVIFTPTNTTPPIYYLYNGTTTSYTGNGTSGIFIWGAQIEVGAFPTSYIPTTTATVTRAADVAVIQGTNFSSWYKYDEGSVYAEFSVARQIAIAGTGIVAMDDGTVNNQNRIFGRGSGATGYGVVFGGVGQADLSPTGVLSANTTAKIATAYQINNFATSGNAGTVQTDTSGSIPTLTIMRIGIDLVSNVYLNGWIRRINYYNRRLDNSQLQAITQ